MFSAKIKEKSIGKMKSMRLLAVLLVPVVALVLGAAVPEAWAKKEFDVAELFFELNNTDGDLGIHALIDGEPWKELEIEAPNGREMLEIEVKGRLRRQGLTEIFFESAEPSFGDLDPADFFLRFPAGTYTIEGETLRGRELENEVELTHVMPAPADGITLNGGEPIVLEAVDCEVGRNVPSVANGSVTIVEAELEIGGEEFTSKYSVILPPDVTSATIPAEFISQTDEFKYEILAREESYNQTAIESCFELE
jgi:hypothetical protein